MITLRETSRNAPSNPVSRALEPPVFNTKMQSHKRRKELHNQNAFSSFATLPHGDFALEKYLLI
jgi:hypothetical protein